VTTRRSQRRLAIGPAPLRQAGVPGPRGEGRRPGAPPGRPGNCEGEEGGQCQGGMVDPAGRSPHRGLHRPGADHGLRRFGVCPPASQLCTAPQPEFETAAHPRELLVQPPGAFGGCRQEVVGRGDQLAVHVDPVLHVLQVARGRILSGKARRLDVAQFTELGRTPFGGLVATFILGFHRSRAALPEPLQYLGEAIVDLLQLLCKSKIGRQLLACLGVTLARVEPPPTSGRP
jgi:hypothetical protein